MSIVIATPTGNIGSRVVTHLLEAGASLTLLTRHPEKLPETVQARTSVHQGALEDAAFVAAATQGADALFWLSPNNLYSPDMFGWYAALGQSVAGAVQTNRIPYVVNLSSAGANHRDGLGPVSGLGRIEAMLDATDAHVLHLRPGFFMENFLEMLDGLRTASSLFMPTPPEIRMPMIATQDIAEVVARKLLARDWSGKVILGLHGPAEVSMTEAAATLAEGLAQPVQYVQVPREAVEQMVRSWQAQGDWPERMADLYSRLGVPEYPFTETRTPETTTPTTLAAFTATVIRPALEAIPA
jgi:uncharacterized protein YbjT (DUF2867 family)